MNFILVGKQFAHGGARSIPKLSMKTKPNTGVASLNNFNSVQSNTLNAAPSACIVQAANMSSSGYGGSNTQGENPQAKENLKGTSPKNNSANTTPKSSPKDAPKATKEGKSGSDKNFNRGEEEHKLDEEKLHKGVKK
eukprot:TRINITY_DN1364_c0_g1_i1.p2 TRINITY_DN1364_c0_g1~~TRINITY_DN1364_c0_g1_i1.p2  ORF type:complete len:137 (-),score=55.48 TRINITY_DN1364_c0_g1_i1:106-516(-)